MFTSFTSYEVSLLISALNASAQDDGRFPRTLREAMLNLSSRLTTEQAEHETTPIIEQGQLPEARDVSEYRVTWSIDIDATSPEVAAEKAREIQMDPFNTATIYEVQSEFPDGPVDIVQLEATPEPGPATLKLSGTMREVAIERVHAGSRAHLEAERGVDRKSAQIHRLTEVVTTPPNWEFSVECMLIGEPLWRVKAGASTHEQAMAYAEDVAREEGVCSVRVIHYQFEDPNVDSMADAHMVCSGNPGDGFSYYGPFDDTTTAENWADRELDGDWWVIELRKPL